jgi:hypothetical protein
MTAYAASDSRTRRKKTEALGIEAKEMVAGWISLYTYRNERENRVALDQIYRSFR